MVYRTHYISRGGTAIPLEPGRIDITPFTIRTKSDTTRNVATGHESLAELFSPFANTVIDYAGDGRISKGGIISSSLSLSLSLPNASEQLLGCKGRGSAGIS